MANIVPGDVVRVTTDPGFTNAAGAPADPTTVNLLWKVGSGGAVTTWTRPAAGPDTQIVKDATGVYHADIPVVEAGVHYFRWEGTGAVVAAEEGRFSVGTYF